MHLLVSVAISKDAFIYKYFAKQLPINSPKHSIVSITTLCTVVLLHGRPLWVACKTKPLFFPENKKAGHF